MDNLSRDVFGNVTFTKQLKENKSFSAAKMKIYHEYSCNEYKLKFLKKYNHILQLQMKSYCLINFKISLN